MISNLVETFAQFGIKFNHDPDIQRCLGRIRFWIQNQHSDVNIVQEIDFLLGMCLTERKCQEVLQGGYQSRNYSSRPAYGQQRPLIPQYASASEYSSDYRPSRRHHHDMLRQVREMTTTVSDMKGRLSEANRHKQYYPY